MPVRFTCRLLVVPTESGKYRIKYGYLGEHCSRLLTINGPAMIQPPDNELTAQELDRWEFSLTNGTGYSFAYQQTSVDAPLVEARRTIEDMIPKGSVSWRLLPMQNDNGERTFAVELHNSWHEQIPKISLASCWENETPQEVRGFPAKMAVQDLGGSDMAFSRMTPIGLDSLPINYPIVFLYAMNFLETLQSRIAALSPERYWISLRTEGYEFDRIPGAELAALLDTLSD